jgi:hypothetical protein
MLFYIRVPSLITPVHCITITEEPFSLGMSEKFGFTVDNVVAKAKALLG